MIVILWLIIGAFIGFVGSRIAGRREGLLGSMVIGIVGAFLGSLIASAFGTTSGSYLTFSWAAFFWSILGAFILSLILNALTRRGHHV